MYRISPFTPIFFNPSDDGFGVKSKCRQLFAATDHILLEIIASSTDVAPTATINNLVTLYQQAITWSKWAINSNVNIYFATISGLDAGFYTITIDSVESEIFKVTTDSDELSSTSLLQYSMPDNRRRTDCAFWIDGVQYFFDFRVQGGFKDDGWNFGVSNEQFETSEFNVEDVYSHEYTSYNFTMGKGEGCPMWFGAMLNRILSCSYVYINGVRYARKEQSVPEINVAIEGVKSYVFVQSLRKVPSISDTIESANQVLIRRVDDSTYRKLSTAEEGDILIL